MKLNMIAVLVCFALGCGSENGVDPTAPTSDNAPPSTESPSVPSGESTVTPPSNGSVPSDADPTADPTADPCLDVVCTDGQVCQNGECLNVVSDSDASVPPPSDTDSGSTDPCAKVTCQTLELCVNGACVPDWVDPQPDLTCPLDHKSLLCHLPNGNKHTICVGNPAVPAHLAIGDTLGACL